MESILVLNAGSSTLKAALFANGRPLRRETVEAGADYRPAIDSLLARFADVGVAAVGHRFVLGGDHYAGPVAITPHVYSKLRCYGSSSPSHHPRSMAFIGAAGTVWPDVPQVACFDSTFHASMPALEKMFAIPRRYFENGIHRRGFHGLSYESIAGQLPAVSARAASGRTAVCHLGNGASLCGMFAGRSQTTTMGFSPIDGLMMATRSGRIDPGVIFKLWNGGMQPSDIRHLLERESGLLGVSGISGDMRVLLSSAEPAAREAIELFCRIVAKEIAAAGVALGGLDAIIFTAGVGEHAAPIRQFVCDRLAWLGVQIDPEKNSRHDERLHADSSTVEIYRLATDEESVIAAHTSTLLGSTP